MTDFDADRINNAIRAVNEAYRERPLDPPYRGDETAAESAARAIRIEAVEQKLMESADFVAEAIGESREDIFKDIGTYAGMHEDNLVGVIVGERIRAYARECAEREVDRV